MTHHYSQIETDAYLDWAFENFSGYIAVDEVYDGPFCLLVIVDTRRYNRLVSRVLDHVAKRSNHSTTLGLDSVNTP